MAYEIPGFVLGVMPANANLSAQTAGQEPTYLYAFVDAVLATGSGVQGAGNQGAVGLPSAGYPALGVLQNNPAINEAAAVMTNGVSKVKAAGILAPGDLVMVQVDGTVIKATTGNYAVGKALEVAAVGDVIAVYVQSYGKV